MIVIVMGVTGSGKSTIGKLLARRLSLPFFDADDYHSPENIRKMSQGIPLTDADRMPWLQRLARLLATREQGGAVLACSALREIYRRHLRQDLRQEPIWILLDGPEAVLRSRLKRRQGHYMAPELLASQLEALERPPYALCIPIGQEPDAIVSTILEQLPGRPR
ncbi:gluconokinase [Flaviaesturariibacter flavus]|uniref:Gluconokinase n=1 Tax=Flaviaesturariibacter flavus TaxID=2502780 RepID=A0A4R1BJX1_9BACT|nr:gluconokinase [Flaviaesturariibacter flavus]TCJ17705.1 gluconokinase [Flaviaesturariibacter flavus]